MSKKQTNKQAKEQLTQQAFKFEVDDEDFDIDDEDFEVDDDDPFYEYELYSDTCRSKSYPNTLDGTNLDVLDIIQKKGNAFSIPEGELKEILAVPHETLAADLEQFIYYYLGVVNDEHYDLSSTESVVPATVSHCVMLLREVGNSTTSLDAVLEVMRQSDEVYYHLISDPVAQVVIPTVIQLGKDNLPKLEEFLFTQGVATYCKENMLKALVGIANCYPEKRAEVLAVFESFGQRAFMEQKQAQFTNAFLNCWFVSSLKDLRAPEFLPMIFSFYKLHLVDEEACTPYKQVKSYIQEEPEPQSFWLSLRECYDRLESVYGHKF